MLAPSVRMQTYLVCAVMIGCFSLLYPKLIHPMLLHLLGLSQPSQPVEQDFKFPKHFRSQESSRPRPSILAADAESKTGAGKRGGLMSMILPIYGVGIVIYLIYTLSKVYKSRKGEHRERKDEFLRHYYRDFHYDVDRGKFRMGHDSSDEEEKDDSPGLSSSELKCSSMPAFTDKDGRFDWAAAYGVDGQPDIYRSAKSLPRDLEALLMRMENEDVDATELSALRARLEKTEREMTKLLQAMDHAEQMVGQFNVDAVEPHVSCPPYDDPEFEEDSEDVATASEGELDGLIPTSSVAES
ncbi:hypothetical protein EG68_03155 [Paragonimus skrjabini miyazakii]|uniref:Resistance to inhibitors of cholinesterase protein 3 N-terminal domain-containing protein n=1 Tax=Paragonimus skrjabini miyazakii TaxID=59628 RepID=A0A8S9Z8E6_9TREM|nr:hypothetical protein EG68_03155 [Paragonimus skrjabini miyazakii]